MKKIFVIFALLIIMTSCFKKEEVNYWTEQKTSTWGWNWTPTTETWWR